MFCTANSVSCSPCDLKFADEGTLQNHMKSKHFDRSVKNKSACTKCDYSFYWKSQYQRHIVIHSKVKAHKCDTCGKYFTRKGSLTSHIKSVHTKESKYECEGCD